MEMTKMKVNPLPVLTWHRLGMNDSSLEIALPQTAVKFTLGGDTAGLRRVNRVRREAEGFSFSFRTGESDRAAEKALKLTGWDSMETGMGEEFARVLHGVQTSYLYIPDNYKNDCHTVINAASEGCSAGELLIYAGAGSEASLVIAVRDGGKPGSDSDTLALQLLLRAEEGAHLKLYVVQLLPGQGLCCLNTGAECAGGAEIELTQISLGAGRTYIGTAVKLSGDKSSFEGDLGYRVGPGRSVDVNYVARHLGRESLSRMNAWGVLEDSSRKIFRGTIDFKEGCSGSVGNEKEEVLLLGEHQINQTIPLILCHEEDVEGNHGATISRLDDQILFYLGSRGLTAKTAEDIISRARLEALISRIPDKEVRTGAQSLNFEEGEADR